MKPIFIAVLVTILATACTTPVQNPPGPPPVQTRAPIPESIASPSNSSSPLVQQKGQYISNNLKIKFNYNADVPEKAWIKEEGNRIYVVPGDYKDYTKGQFIEVHTKEPKDTINATITKQFLANFDSKKCYVADTVQRPSPLQKGYQFKIIEYPDARKESNSDQGIPFIETSGCPQQYSLANGIRYFIYDPKHPTRFAFVDIGQYAISSTANSKTPWQDTIEFID